MSTIFTLSKKSLIAVLLVVTALAVLPIAGVAAEEGDPPAIDTARLEAAYDRLVDWYDHQTQWMDKADANIARIQEMINKATERGYDTSSVQAALDAFSAVYPGARVYNLEAAAILSAHAGFDENGAVTDPSAAIETLRALQAALNNAYQAMGGENHAGRALMEAIKAFIEANRPAP